MTVSDLSQSFHPAPPGDEYVAQDGGVTRHSEVAALRVCVVLAEPAESQAHLLGFLERLCDDDRFRLDCVLTLAPGSPRGGFFHRYLALEERLLGPKRTASTDRFRRLAARVPRIGPLGGSDLPAGCDVVVDFTHDPRALPLAATARLGLWRASAYAPGAGLAEAARGADGTEITVTRIDAPGAPARPVASAVFATKFVASRHVAYIREKSLPLILGALARARLGESAARPAPGEAAPARPALIPYLGRLASQLARRTGERVNAKAGRKPGQWRLMTGTGGWQDFDPAKAETILPVGNHYWADPFLFRDGGRTHLFFEDFDYATGKGNIAAGVFEEGCFRLLGTVLDRPYHLSYPMVFAHEGAIYMLPETLQAGRLEIWRAKRFPMEWELHATALEDVPAADCVLVPDRGRWWLFANVASDFFSDFSSELNVYEVSGPDLRGLRPHPLNPVVVGSLNARGGGRVFRDGGRLIRCAQDNTHGVYGYGLNFMEITRLDSTGYEERLARHVAPDFIPGLIGCHHFDAAGDRFVIDARLARGHWKRAVRT